MAKTGIKVELDKEVIKQFKAACALEGKSMKAQFEEILLHWLESRKVAAEEGE